MSTTTIGFAMCGSFCTYKSVIPQISILKDFGFNVQPIMSRTAFETDTRFGESKYFIDEIERITENKIWNTLREVEPIGPKKLLDLLIIEPATGNTIAKLANGIADTPITLAAKAHLRNAGPILLGISTNDALSGNAKNIGLLMNTRNYFFLPLRQDNCQKKPCSIVADFSKTLEYAVAALDGIQLQPILGESH
ncbi:MAG: dipicolinate synthase subunit B [Oscillospiraceae bacterium]|nr:dipicolinate synthase subunit B [Oscillospiraceae bacterium]